MNVKEIVHEYLRVNGYDGLCSDDCGCGLDDLAPCEQCFDACVPAYHRTDDGFYPLKPYPDMVGEL